MKNVFLIFISLGLILTACSKEEEVTEEQLIDLTGEWTGNGYECPKGTFHDEIVDITHDLSTGVFAATKITGDDCVLAGEITFSGNFDGKEKSLRMNAIGGSAADPSSVRVNGTMVIINSDSFSATALGTTVQFVRN